MEQDYLKIAVIPVVTVGFGGDMLNILLYDIYNHSNNVKSRKTEGLMPRLMKMVESEIERMQ